MTEQPQPTASTWTRWRERRRAKRQRALAREFHAGAARPGSAAYTDAANHAHRWTSFLGGGGAGGI